MTKRKLADLVDRALERFAQEIENNSRRRDIVKRRVRVRAKGKKS